MALTDRQQIARRGKLTAGDPSFVPKDFSDNWAVQLAPGPHVGVVAKPAVSLSLHWLGGTAFAAVCHQSLRSRHRVRVFSQATNAGLGFLAPSNSIRSLLRVSVGLSKVSCLSESRQGSLVRV